MFRFFKKLNVRVVASKFCTTSLHSSISGDSVDANIVRSKIFNVEIPKRFIEEYVWENLDRWHNKTAVLCGETRKSFSYSELYQKSRAVASFLQNRVPVLKEKDVVAVILPNIPEYAIITLGIIQAGFAMTTVNPNYTADEISYQLQHSNPKFIFTVNNLWPLVTQALRNVKSVTPVAIVKQRQNEDLPNETINFEDMLKQKKEFVPKASRNVEDVAIIPFSSGTTGLPKGVELTHKSIVSNMYQVNMPGFKLLRKSEGEFQEVLPLVLPIFHAYGLIAVMLHGLASGCKLVTISKFTPNAFINMLEVHQPTFAHLVPPLVLFLINNDSVLPKHISQCRVIFSSAAPIGEEDIARLNEKAKIKTLFLQVYGLTEASPFCFIQTPDLPNGIKNKGSGLVIPNTEFLISSSESNDHTGLGPYKTGEIYIRGPQVMKGYYKNKEATAGALDKDGWLRTGDIAHYDTDGHIFITDRLKEMIKVKGFQVAPAELEEILRSHPDVEDAAVVGVPHKEYGEVPKAFIVSKKNCKIDTSKINDFVGSKVTSFKHLKGGIVMLNSIPKTASGKILRRDLKKLN